MLENIGKRHSVSRAEKKQQPLAQILLAICESVGQSERVTIPLH